MSETLEAHQDPVTGETVMLPPASGQVIEIGPRAEGEGGVGTGAGAGVGAGQGEGDPQPTPAVLADAGQSFEDYRAQRVQTETVQRARQRVTRRQQPAPAEPEAAQPEDMAAAREAYVAERMASVEAEAEAAAEAAPAEGAPQEPRGQRQPRRTAEGQSTARTVARNAAEAVTGVPRGALAAFASLFEAGDDLADWLNARIPLSDVPAGDPSTPGRTIGRAIRSLQPGREPETLSGHISEEVSQFITGFLRGGVTLRRFGALQGGGALRTAGRAAAAGAIADFFYQEADEANLAAAWQRAGLPRNALTDFLATDPADEAATNRLRNAVAGVVVGAALDGAIAVARGARAGFAARRGANLPAPAAEPATLSEASGRPANPARDVMLLGDPNRPLVEIAPRRAQGDAGARMAEAAAEVARPGEDAARALTGVADDMATGGVLSGRQDAPEVFINWGRIATPDDVQGVMRDMAEAFRPAIDEARRGVQTNEETARLAAQMGMRPEDILSRARGEPWNAETALAARQLYTASGERLLEAARAAAAPGAGPLEAATFRRMMATHYAIQAQVLGARTETARALQAWAIPAESGGRQMRMIEDLLESSGGVATAQGMARRLALLGNLPPDQVGPALAQFTNRGWGGRSLEAVQQVWINVLLSSPETHLANITGNALNLPLTIAERGLAAGIGRGPDAAHALEAPVMLYGVITGFRDALRLGARTYADDGVEVARMIGRQDVPRQGAISSQAMGVDPGSGLGRALDFAGHSIVSAPGRAMGAEDAFFKSILFRMELHAQSLRMAMREVPLRPDGSTDAVAVGARMAEIVRNPPEAVRLAAADEALYRTFNRDLARGTFGRALMDLRTTDSPAANLAMSTVLPFVRTPINLFKYGLERTPLAPLVDTFRADIAAGGARRDAAVARVALGSMIVAHTYQLAEQGFVTGYGPSDPRERETWLRAGNQPYSVRIGNAWVPYNRLDPYGFMLGLAGDLRELMDRRDLGEREELEVTRTIAATAAMASNALGNRSFFRGVASLAEALDNRHPSAERYVGQTMGSLLVPGIVRAVGQAIDPTMYDRGQGYIAGRLAGLAGDPGIPRRNLWGETMRRPGVDVLGAAGAAISPIRPTIAAARPVDREMQRLSMGLQPIDQNGTVVFGGAPVNLRNVNPQALDTLRRWAGNEHTERFYGDKGLADALDDMVQGRGPLGAAYERASDEGRERAIREVAQFYRTRARDRLIADPEFADVADFVRRRGDDMARPRDVPVPRTDNQVRRALGDAPPARQRQPSVR